MDEEAALAGKGDVETYYVETLMPPKLEASMAYLKTRTPWRDVRVLRQTVVSLIGPAAGKK